MKRPHTTSGQGRSGASLQQHNLQSGIRARFAERRFHKPRPMSHQHALNVKQHVADGTADREWRHVLMDYERNQQLKARMLTRLEAWKRNQVLRGSGFAWAVCERGGR